MDILERLRQDDHYSIPWSGLAGDAADEIARLRADNERLIVALRTVMPMAEEAARFYPKAARIESMLRAALAVGR